MAFREVRVFEVREVLRVWLRGEGIRSTERLAGVDRKTVRRYVVVAAELGLVRDSGDEQLSDDFVGSVVAAVRPHRADGRGEAWGLLVANHQLIEGWLKKDKVTVRKAHEDARPARLQVAFPTHVCDCDLHVVESMIEGRGVRLGRRDGVTCPLQGSKPQLRIGGESRGPAGLVCEALYLLNVRGPDVALRVDAEDSHRLFSGCPPCFKCGRSNGTGCKAFPRARR